MVVEISKNKWKNCGIKAIYYYNKEKKTVELWLKMSDIEIQLGHPNIADAVLKRIRKYLGKKAKYITEKEKEQYKCYFGNKKGVFIIEELARDLSERCKLPKVIELRKKLGYNHDDIMIQEETSIAEKIIKLFPNGNIV